MGKSRRLTREIRLTGDRQYVKGSTVDNCELVIGSCLFYLADGEGFWGARVRRQGGEVMLQFDAPQIRRSEIILKWMVEGLIRPLGPGCCRT